MNIIVCIKRVPETTDADVIIDKSGKDIEKSGLVFDLNEWDTYAIEEAILLKEKTGGTVTVISMGGEESNESLRKCLAMGADDAIRKCWQRRSEKSLMTSFSQACKLKMMDMDK
jgi:electron transfer flavoprotein beta subunit